MMQVPCSVRALAIMDLHLVLSFANLRMSMSLKIQGGISYREMLLNPLPDTLEVLLSASFPFNA